MKINQFVKTLSFAAIAAIVFFASSCSNDDDANVPQTLTVEEQVASIKRAIMKEDGKLIFGSSDISSDTAIM